MELNPDIRFKIFPNFLHWLQDGGRKTFAISTFGITISGSPHSKSNYRKPENNNNNKINLIIIKSNQHTLQE